MTNNDSHELAYFNGTNGFVVEEKTLKSMMAQIVIPRF